MVIVLILCKYSFVSPPPEECFSCAFWSARYQSFAHPKAAVATTKSVLTFLFVVNLIWASRTSYIYSIQPLNFDLRYCKYFLRLYADFKMYWKSKFLYGYSLYSFQCNLDFFQYIKYPLLCLTCLLQDTPLCYSQSKQIGVKTDLCFCHLLKDILLYSISK